MSVRDLLLHRDLPECLDASGFRDCLDRSLRHVSVGDILRAGTVFPLRGERDDASAIAIAAIRGELLGERGEAPKAAEGTLLVGVGDPLAAISLSGRALRRVDLSGCRLGLCDAVCRALSQLPGLTELSACAASDAAASQLALLSGLRWLSLRGSTVGDAGAKALARLRELRGLDLRGSSVGADGAFALSTLRHLEHLDVSRNGLGDSLAVLARLTTLRSLDVSGNDGSAEACAALSALTRLRGLRVGGNHMRSEALLRLARSLKALTELDLYPSPAVRPDSTLAKVCAVQRARRDLNIVFTGGHISLAHPDAYGRAEQRLVDAARASAWAAYAETVGTRHVVLLCKFHGSPHGLCRLPEHLLRKVLLIL